MTAGAVRRRRWSVAAYILAPMAVLAIDLVASPVIFETSRPKKISVISLFERERVALATFRSHAIENGLSRIGRADYLAAYRDSSPNALIVSVFADEEGKSETASFSVVVKRIEPSPVMKG